MSEISQKLMRPAVALLPRVIDQLSFLYIDIARIVRDDNGVKAIVYSAERERTEEVYLPTASLAALMLAPGTSITQPAAQQIMRDGTTIIMVGNSLGACYGSMTHRDASTRWLHAQVEAWADIGTRTEVARRLYRRRFSDQSIVDGMSIAQLRGMEGQRVKKHYRLLASKHNVGFRRSYKAEDFESSDPLNQALSAAHHIMYGVAHAAILCLGMSPALGFIHSGNQRSFVYDIADLYKMEVAAPVAFAHYDDDDALAKVRRVMRSKFKLLKLTAQMVSDIQAVISPEDKTVSSEEANEDLVFLWDPETGRVEGGRNYAAAD